MCRPPQGYNPLLQCPNKSTYHCRDCQPFTLPLHKLLRLLALQVYITDDLRVQDPNAFPKESRNQLAEQGRLKEALGGFI